MIGSEVLYEARRKLIPIKMHNSHVIDLLVDPVHVQDETEVGDGASHVNRPCIGSAAAKLHSDQIALAEFELIVQCVLCLTSVEWSRVDSQLKQLFAEVFKDGITQAFELCFNIALPFEELIFLLGEDINLNEVCESVEESQSFEQESPTNGQVVFLFLKCFSLIFRHLKFLVFLSRDIIKNETQVLFF